MSLRGFLIFWGIVAISTPGVAAVKPETPHLAFVTEYIRELSDTVDVMADGEKEIADAKDDNEKILAGIHASTLIQFELRSQIQMLKSMTLSAPFNDLIPTITDLNQKKIDIHQRLIEISTAFISGPKPGVDFGKLAAEMPKLRAQLDYIDKTFLQSSPLIFATLINEKPDSKNHVSHLIITKEERSALIKKLDDDFGDKLNQKNPNYMISVAIVLKSYFQKEYKCSDEPWD